MKEVIMWALIYVGVMLLGYSMRRLGVFRKEDKKVLANLIFYITLPAMLMSSFGGVTVDFWFIIAFIMGLGTNLFMVIAGLLVSMQKPRTLQALYMQNTAGFNLGNITMPFLRNFYTAGIPYLCMFDIGDTFFTMGLTYMMASSRLERKETVSLKSMLLGFFQSIPFDAYFLMTVLSLLHIQFPEGIATAIEFVGRGNGFLVMFMIGISFELEVEKDDLKDVLSIIGLRYLCGILFAVLFYVIIPAPQAMREILAIAVFSSVPNVAIIYSERLGIENSKLAATLNPISTALAVPVMTAVMLVLS